MKKLEAMARELFNRFSIIETGRHSDWNCLSYKRKNEWMKDVLMITTYFTNELKSEVKPVPNNQQHDTVYTAAYNNALRDERMHFIELVDNVHENLIDELREFQESNRKKGE